ncbi:DUF1120 domain-containing protein [Serratia fonticola]|uniref:DUF1120 domain-containing protein n=1 Tax=Serratia fonticola TaxID=47917 RepID=UPI00217C0C3C|nr:DUF1120 domain-containing protein [Serratia fonticola]CAI1527103.1 Protein of uncharacterised function (DUF1120) [Serratia fonticola]CAI1795714.1 Protein of uncharacterised function (DUF1120) [Serratia fonticola]CAI1844384.1 Protein of uncharacterised function (DUF1120) [Serratia fonticola]
MLVNLNNGTEMNVFKMTALSLALATSAGSFSVMAVETSQIAVTGSVFPSACSLSVDGLADFGNLKKTELAEQSKLQNAYQLGYKSVSFTVQCSSAAKVALSAQADMPISRSITMGVVSHINETENTIRTEPGQLASLGEIDEQDIGYFTIALASATLDSKDAKLISSKNNGSTWSAVSSVADHLLYQDGSGSHSWGENSTPQEATNISGVITISAALDTTVVDELKDTINFNTGTTLSLHYL